MAIAISEPVAELASTTDGTSYAMGAFTPAADAILVVFVMTKGSMTVPGTMSGGGLTWTLKSNFLFDVTVNMRCFWAKTGASPASCTPTFDCTGDGASGCFMAAFELTGADIVTADPIKQLATGNNSNADPTVTFAAALGTNNGYMAANGGDSQTSTPPASWTETVDAAIATPTCSFAAAYRAGGETGTTVTFTRAASIWGMMAIEVYVAGAGPAGTILPQMLQHHGG